MVKNLTPKQERFCLAYVETGNASEAYRRAYNTQKMKSATVNRQAKALIDTPKVAARIERLFDYIRARHDVTVDSLTQELDEARVSAMFLGNPSAAVSATMGKAKLHGLVVDRQDVKTRVSLDDLTDDELDAYIDRLEQEAASREADAATTH